MSTLKVMARSVYQRKCLDVGYGGRHEVQLGLWRICSVGSVLEQKREFLLCWPSLEPAGMV